MNNPDQEKLRRWREYFSLHWSIWERWREQGCYYPHPNFPPFPDDLRDMRCGAKTRAGTPCKQKAIYINGRCKWHGGMSTGPKTEAGKEKVRINGRKGGRPRKKLMISKEDQRNPSLLNATNCQPGAKNDRAANELSDATLRTIKPEPMGGRENLTFARCADCSNLSAGWTCIPAQRGLLVGIAPVRPNLGERRLCNAFIAKESDS